MGGEAEPVEPGQVRPSRTLPLGATFGDLVSTVRALEDAGEGDAALECSFRALGANQWRVEADLAIAVRPLPEAATNVAARLRSGSGPVQILSRWGRLGPAEANLNLVAMFSGAPWQGDTSAVALFLGSDGITARGAGVRLPESLSLPMERLTPEHVDALTSLGTGVVLATADSSMGLGAMITALQPLTERGLRVGLGVLLPPNTRLPEVVGEPADSTTQGLCGPPLAELAESEIGERDISELRDAIRSLQPGVQGCIARVGGGMRPEGRIGVRLRIAASGQIAESCVTEDQHGVVPLRACVLEQVRGLRFGAVAGAVDVEFPLRLSRRSVAEATWLCEP